VDLVSKFDIIIEDIIRREGGAKATNTPGDLGGRTQYGVSERSFPEAWADGKVTEREAKDIYLQKFVKGPKYDHLPEVIAAQVVDWAVTSGPYIATKGLQLALGVEADGVMGPQTLAAVQQADLRSLGNKVAVERLKMYGRLVSSKPTQAKFALGWITRAAEFIV
jgi:lysozyme family protein